MSIFHVSTQFDGLFSHFYEYFIAPAVFRAMESDLEGDFVQRIPEGCRVLDVGCGGGHHVLAIAQMRPDLEVVGLDLSPQLVAHARRKSAAQNTGRVSFVEGTALDLPFESESFDHVYSAGSIKHWGDKHAKRRGLQECLRVLRPGGAFLVMEADRGAHYEDIVRWARQSRVPRPLLPLLHAYFATWVVSQSIDLDDARDLWAELPIVDKAGPRRIREQPALVMTGVRPA